MKDGRNSVTSAAHQAANPHCPSMLPEKIDSVCEAMKTDAVMTPAVLSAQFCRWNPDERFHWPFSPNRAISPRKIDSALKRFWHGHEASAPVPGRALRRAARQVAAHDRSSTTLRQTSGSGIGQSIGSGSWSTSARLFAEGLARARIAAVVSGITPEAIALALCGYQIMELRLL